MRVVASTKGTVLLSSASQMAVPMIYAHWEGFAKEALQLYAEYLEVIGLPQGETSSALLAYAWEGSFAKLRDKLTHAKKEEIVNRFFGSLESALVFEKKQKDIDTKSNLMFDVMEDLATAFCLDIGKLRTHKQNLDALVHRRNSIAHGGREQSMNDSNVAEYRDLVVLLMTELESTLIAAIASKSYRRIRQVDPAEALAPQPTTQ
jgi:hypothetical protein